MWATCILAVSHLTTPLHVRVTCKNRSKLEVWKYRLCDLATQPGYVLNILLFSFSLPCHPYLLNNFLIFICY